MIFFSFVQHIFIRYGITVCRNCNKKGLSQI